MSYPPARLFYPVVAAVMLLSGCIVQNFGDISVKPDTPATADGAMPLRAGLFFPEDFRNRRFNIHQHSFRGNIDIGRSLMPAVYALASSSFRAVVFLESFVPGSPPPVRDLDLVVVPKISDFQWFFHLKGPASEMEARLSLVFEFHDPDGRLRHSLISSGSRSDSTLSMAFSGLSSLQSAERPTRLVCEDVLKDMAAKLATDRGKILAVAGKCSP